MSKLNKGDIVELAKDRGYQKWEGARVEILGLNENFNELGYIYKVKGLPSPNCIFTMLENDTCGFPEKEDYILISKFSAKKKKKLLVKDLLTNV